MTLLINFKDFNNFLEISSKKILKMIFKYFHLAISKNLNILIFNVPIDKIYLTFNITVGNSMMI